MSKFDVFVDLEFAAQEAAEGTDGEYGLPAVKFDVAKLKQLWVGSDRDCVVEWGGKSLEIKANEARTWEHWQPADFLAIGDKIDGAEVLKVDELGGGHFILRYTLEV